MYQEVARTYRALARGAALVEAMVSAMQRAGVIQTLLGRLWFMLEPLANMLIYYFLLVVIFRVDAGGQIHPFVLIMLGLVHYDLLQRTANGATSAIVNHAITMLQAPIEPLVFIAAHFYKSLRESMWPIVLYATVYLLFGPPLTSSLWFYPLILATQLVLVWSLAIALATIGVYFRDLQHLLSIGLRLLMYLSPVVYLVTFLPAHVRWWVLFNPVACIFALYQWCLLRGGFPEGGLPPPEPVHLVALVFWVLAAALGSHALYGRLRADFTKAF